MQKENPGTGSTQKSWWQTPWAYKESLAIVTGLVFVGWLLQVNIGVFNYDIIRFPVNVVVFACVFIFVSLLSLKPKVPLFNWLSGVPLSVSTIAALLLMSLIMGLIPQVPPAAHSHSLTGFDAVTRSWAFVLVYFLTIVNLAFTFFVERLCFLPESYRFIADADVGWYGCG